MSDAKPLTVRVRETREARGLTQDALCRSVGISRQALSAIESGRSVPSTALALALGQALGARVEALFALPETGTDVTVEARAEASLRAGARVVLASVEDAMVAHRAPVGLAADGVVVRAAAGRVTVRLFGGSPPPTVFVAGCGPVLPLLAQRASRGDQLRVIALPATSRQALKWLGEKLAHAAGAHLFDERSRRWNAPAVERALGPGQAELVAVARWEVGVALAAARRSELSSLELVFTAPLRWVERPRGAGAQARLVALRRRYQIREGALTRQVANDHDDVAAAVALGAADAGICLRASAEARDLALVPIGEEPFDLAVGSRSLRDRRLEQLLAALDSASFREDASALPGVDARGAGCLVGG